MYLSSSERSFVSPLFFFYYKEEFIMTIEMLRAKLQLIIGEKTNKLKELEVTSPELIDCPILECEINDAVYMIVVLNSDISDDEKRAGIKAINDQTTSASIYDTVNEYLESK
jgi:hypothetical protein